MTADPCDVIVVGAGLAGLVVAREMERAGRSVVVLEARARVGGRVHSNVFEDGQWCERGAEFLNASDTELLALCDELGVERLERPVVADCDRAFLDLGGRPAPAAFHGDLAEAEARYDRALTALADEYLVATANGDADALRRLDDASLAELMADWGLGVAARVWLGRVIRTEWMLPPDELSQLFVAEQTAFGAGEHDRERYRVSGGNDQIAIRLAAALSCPIRLSTPVRRVDPVSGSVELLDGEVLTAASVVVTVPLPVLGRIWPSIPPELSSVGYGVGGKISMQLDRRLWLDYGRDGHVLSDRAWGEMWDSTDVQPGDAGVLTTLLSSHDGAALLALPDCTARVTAEAERIFPGARGLVRSTVFTDWTNDPWSLGAYVAFGPGQLLAARAAMAQAHGRLWIAGEHADERSGFMEGAVRSALRVSAAILAAV